MKPPGRAHIETAVRLLALEGGGPGGADAEAAARVYDKFHHLLDPLLGAAGVQAIFARSAKLSQVEFACLADRAVVGSGETLRECLAGQEAPAAAATGVALFAAFLALITEFIGARLTTEVLRRAWPTIPERAFQETNQ